MSSSIYNMCLWDGLGTELPAEDRENWDAFTSGQLADTNKRNTVDLVSHDISYIIHLNLNHLSYMHELDWAI